MKIYNYHPETKEYLYESDANLDPLETRIQGTDVFAIPGSSTIEAPPECTENEIQMWADTEWVIVPDLRGTVYYIGTEEFTITEINTPLPDGYSMTPVKTEEEILNDQRAEINLNRDSTIESGFVYIFPDTLTGTVDIKSDRDIVNISGLGTTALQLKAIGDTTTKLLYRDKDNVTHEMTADEMIEFGLAFMTWYSNLYKDAWDLKDAL